VISVWTHLHPTGSNLGGKGRKKNKRPKQLFCQTNSWRRRKIQIKWRDRATRIPTPRSWNPVKIQSRRPFFLCFLWKIQIESFSRHSANNAKGHKCWTLIVSFAVFVRNQLTEERSNTTATGGRGAKWIKNLK